MEADDIAAVLQKCKALKRDRFRGMLEVHFDGSGKIRTIKTISAAEPVEQIKLEPSGTKP